MTNDHRGTTMRTRTQVTAAATALALVAAGCGASSSSSDKGAAKPVNPNTAEVSPAGDIPDNQAFVAYTPPSGGFSVKVPEGWARTGSGGATTFTDKLNSVTIEAVPAKRPLTVAQAKLTELPKVKSKAPGFQPGKVSAVTRKAGRGIRMNYLVDFAPNPVTGKVTRDAVERYVFFHGGKNVVLTLAGPKGADNVDPWMIVTDSLRFTG